MYVCNLIQIHLSFVTIFHHQWGPGPASLGVKKRGGKNKTVKIHNTTPGPNVRRKKKRGQGKKTKHIIMYTWSEVKRLIIIQEAMPLKVKERDTQKARTNEEHHQDVT